MSALESSMYLYDDSVARNFVPFAATRPIGELLFGGFTGRRRVEVVFGLPCEGHLAGPDLVGFDEEGSAPGCPADADRPRRARVLLNSRFVPEWGAELPQVGSEAVALLSGGSVCGWVVPSGQAIPEERLVSAGMEVGERSYEIRGTWIESVWHHMDRSSAQVVEDFEARHVANAGPDSRAAIPPGVHVLGDIEHLSVGNAVAIEPGVVLDVRAGPVRLDDGVSLSAFTRLAGPSWIGPGSSLLGGTFSGVSIGPRCKVRGELEETVVLGYSNKAHDGFLGHSLLGCWINLGAGTTNSDLKNNYGPVRLRTPEGLIDTGLTKVGCFLGDHVKTGIGTMLNTGTLVGAGSNLFGGLMPPTWVPPFRWGSGSDLTPYRLDRFLEVAKVAMGRRNVALTPGLQAVLERAWHRAQDGDPAGAHGGVSS